MADTERGALTKPKKRAGIQSVEVGMRVLTALADLGKSSTLSAVVKGCGLSPSQTHRYLASLGEAGMVKQTSSGTYDLGPAALRLGLGALARVDVFREADAEIATLCEKTGCTVMLAALGPAGPTIVRWHVGRPPITTSLAVGSLLSLVFSATGQVFLAFRPKHETAGLVEEALGASPDITHAAVEGIRNRVRAQGYAEVGGTVIPGLHARAYPIFDIQGEAALVATVVSTSSQSQSVGLKGGVAVRATCERISACVGGKKVTNGSSDT
jgi:DNA-binding IclR family transcriptional regulator